MRIRSLPHFAHTPIGKSTHTKGLSYFHVNYITRDDACSKTISEHMPSDREGARPFFEQMAYKEGIPANARIADTFIIALPLELSKEQRHEAIQRFMEKIGQGRIAWMAAFHDMGKDEQNPHCHLIFRDADIETGRKVVGTTTSAKDVKEAKERGWRVPPRMTTKDLRVAWCNHLNAEMQRHGLDVRFDQRRLKDRGIARQAEIHLGRKGHAMAKANKEFESRDRARGDHVNVYTLLDAGSRRDHNARIREANQNNKGKQSGFAASPEERQQKDQLRELQTAKRKALYQEQKQDRTALREAHAAEQLAHQRWARGLYATARQKAFESVADVYQDRWKEVREIPNRDVRDHAADGLRAQQKKSYAESAMIEIDRVRPEKNAAWQTLKETQDAERQALKQTHTQEQAALTRQQIAERYALQERWQQTHLNKAADSISAKFEVRQSMPIVQANAVAMIKLRSKQQRVAYSGSDEAIGYFSESARADGDRLNAIRLQLTAQRQTYHMRAAASAQRRTAPGQIANGRAANRKETAALRQQREQSDKRHSLKQAVANGRTLSTSALANASPDVKAAAAAKEKRNRARYEDLFGLPKTERKGKGRNGGRSGR